MLQERIEAKWVDAFARVFRLCDVKPGEPAAILSETQSRPALTSLAELALSALGARPFHVIVPTPPQRAPVPVRSTGASDAIGDLGPVVTALAAAGLVVDCTVEGLLHAPELPRILSGGARVLMVSNEHPEALGQRRQDPTLTVLRRLEKALKVPVARHAPEDATRLSLSARRLLRGGRDARALASAGRRDSRYRAHAFALPGNRQASGADLSSGVDVSEASFIGTRGAGGGPAGDLFGVIHGGVACPPP